MNKRNQYTYEQKLGAITRVRAGESLDQVAKSIGSCPASIRNWMNGKRKRRAAKPVEHEKLTKFITKARAARDASIGKRVTIEQILIDRITLDMKLLAETVLSMRE